MAVTCDIVAKLWNLCNVLKDDGVTYHQDFNVIGAGPMVEIFTDRMEISNLGLPLIDTLRFIDEPSRSQNETLASLMRGE